MQKGEDLRFFRIRVYSCKCGAKFREYTRDGKHRFMLKLEKSRGFWSSISNPYHV